jgi:polyphosphate kinase
VPGVSENIGVCSVLGRFLEHSRIFRFETAEETTTYIGSADMMPRNLDGRIEVVTPVDDPGLSDEIAGICELALTDTAGAWTLDPDGGWDRRRPTNGEQPFSSQEALMAQALESDGAEVRADRREAAVRRLVRRSPGDDASA